MANNIPDDDPYAEIPVKDFSYTNNPNLNSPTKSSPTKWMVSSGIILLVIIVAVAVLILHHKKTPAPKTTTPGISKVQPNSFDLSFNPSTTYNSNNFFLSVSYPKDWKVNETTSALTILSPITKLKDAQGQLVSSKVLLSVFNQGQIPTGFGTNGSSVAVLDSTKLSYSKPASDQAAQTYITFVQYPATTIKGGLDAIYVTGNDGYTKLQNIPNTDIDNINPLVVISFLSCSDIPCSTTSNLTISSTQWTNTAFSGLVENIVKSFIFN